MSSSLFDSFLELTLETASVIGSISVSTQQIDVNSKEALSEWIDRLHLEIKCLLPICHPERMDVLLAKNETLTLPHENSDLLVGIFTGGVEVEYATPFADQEKAIFSGHIFFLPECGPKTLPMKLVGKGNPTRLFYQPVTAISRLGHLGGRAHFNETISKYIQFIYDCKRTSKISTAQFGTIWSYLYPYVISIGPMVTHAIPCAAPGDSVHSHVVAPSSSVPVDALQSSSVVMPVESDFVPVSISTHPQDPKKSGNYIPIEANSVSVSVSSTSQDPKQSANQESFAGFFILGFLNEHRPSNSTFIKSTERTLRLLQRCAFRFLCSEHLGCASDSETQMNFESNVSKLKEKCLQCKWVLVSNGFAHLESTNSVRISGFGSNMYWECVDPRYRKNVSFGYIFNTYPVLIPKSHLDAFVSQWNYTSRLGRKPIYEFENFMLTRLLRMPAHTRFIGVNGFESIAYPGNTVHSTLIVQEPRTTKKRHAEEDQDEDREDQEDQAPAPDQAPDQDPLPKINEDAENNSPHEIRTKIVQATDLLYLSPEDLGREYTLKMFADALICPICVRQNSFAYELVHKHWNPKKVNKRTLHIATMVLARHVFRCYEKMSVLSFGNTLFYSAFKSFTSKSITGHYQSRFVEFVNTCKPVRLSDVHYIRWKHCLNAYALHHMEPVIVQNCPQFAKIYKQHTATSNKRGRLEKESPASERLQDCSEDEIEWMPSNPQEGLQLKNY